MKKGRHNGGDRALLIIMAFNFRKLNFVVNERMSTSRRGKSHQPRAERSGTLGIKEQMIGTVALQGQKQDYM